MTWVDYFRTAIALIILVSFVAGVFYLGRLISDPYPRVRVRYHGRIEVTPSRALQVRPEAELPEWAAWHAAVLFSLSPELRGEFANSPNYEYQHIEDEPAGSSVVVDGASRPRPTSGVVE